MVVAKSSLLQIYRVVTISTNSNASSGDGIQTQRRAVLELAKEHKLFGNIESMVAVGNHSTGRDALALSFKDAKVSVVEFDESINDLRVISLHYFEDDKFKYGRTQFTSYPKLRVDPKNRCLVMEIFDSSLVVIPLKGIIGNDKSDWEDEDDMLVDMDRRDMDSDMLGSKPKAKSPSKSPQSNKIYSKSPRKTTGQSIPSFVIPFRDIGNGIQNVRDYVFLHGYYEPTLLILFENPPLTSTSRLALVKDTCSAVAVSINLMASSSTRTHINPNAKSHPIIWTIDKLPYSSFKLASVEEPLGGVFVFATNQLLYVHQRVVCGLGLNSEYANLDTDIYVTKNANTPVASSDTATTSQNPNTNQILLDKSDFEFTLDNSHCTFIASDKLLLALKGGELFIVHLVHDTSNRSGSIQHLFVTKAGASVISSNICRVSSQLLFIGSRLGDSLLIHYMQKQLTSSNSNIGNKSLSDVANETDEPPLKKQKTNKENEFIVDPKSRFTPWRNAEEEQDEEDILYKHANAADVIDSNVPSINYTFTVCDSLVNVGPIGDFVVGESFDQQSISIANAIATTGNVANSGSTEPNKNHTTTANISRQMYLNMVTCSGYGKNGALAVLQYGIRPEVVTAFDLAECRGSWALHYNFPSSSHSTNLQSNSLLTNSNTEFHSLLLLSKLESTMMLETGEELQEITDRVQYVVNQPTIDAGNVLNKEKIVQVYRDGIRILNGVYLDKEILVNNKSETNDTETKLSMSDSNGDTPNLHIYSSSIEDPFIAVVLSDKSLRLYKVQRKFETSQISRIDLQSATHTGVATCFLFYDETNAFIHQHDFPSPDKDHQAFLSESHTTNSDISGADYDEEDVLLYSKANRSSSTSNVTINANTNINADSTFSKQSSESNDRNCCLALVKADGSLEIYRLEPHIELIYTCPNLSRYPAILSNTLGDAPLSLSTSIQSSTSFTSSSTTNISHSFSKDTTSLNSGTSSSEPQVVEFSIHYLSANTFANIRHHKIVVLTLILDTEDVVTYTGFFPSSSKSIRFSKVEHEIITRSKPSQAPSDFYISKIKKFEDASMSSDSNSQPSSSNIKQALFIAGSKPVWIVCERSFVRLYAMNAENASITTGSSTRRMAGIAAFTAFHNINCRSGFIYINSYGVLKICQLSSAYGSGVICYESNNWIIRKIPLRLSMHHIAYHTDSKVFAITVSYKVARQMPAEEEYEMETQQGEEGVPPQVQSQIQSQMQTEEPQPPKEMPLIKGTVLPADDKFELRLISPITWETIDKIELEQHEHALCIRVCTLRCQHDERVGSGNTSGNSSGYRSYIVIGTGYVNGEDRGTKGRILLFDIIPVENQYRDPNQPDQVLQPKLKYIFSKEQKGSVSAIDQIDGYLVVAVGPKVIVYNFSSGSDLVGIAFYDGPIYIVNITTIKNYALCADAYHSVFLLCFKEYYTEGTSGVAGRQLFLLAKDYSPLCVFATEFLVNQHSLALLVADANRNLSIYTYAPQSLESRGGQMLVCKGDFHIGCHVEKFARLNMINTAFSSLSYSSSSASTSSSSVSTTGHYSRAVLKHAVIYGALDGSIGCISPVEEVVFKRLFALQTKITNGLQHIAGLNPKSWRMVKPQQKLIRNVYQNVLDGDLIFKYIHMDYTEQKKLAKQIGTTPEQIIDNLQELAYATQFF